jgi:hypothetical protein
MRAAARLLGDDGGRARMGEQALAFAGRHRGATVRTVELLRQLIALAFVTILFSLNNERGCTCCGLIVRERAATWMAAPRSWTHLK